MQFVNSSTRSPDRCAPMIDEEASAPAVVCRIATANEWDVARRTGALPTRDIDARDGFLHLSGIDQVLNTANRHFDNEDALLVLCAQTASFGDALRWEKSGGGELFPHLYGAFDAALVCDVRALYRDPSGDFAFAEACSE